MTLDTYKRRLSFKYLFRRGNQDIFTYLPRAQGHFFTESVRGGLETLIEVIWGSNPCKVLLPVFIAEGVIGPFKNKHVSIVNYKLTPGLSPDLEDIRQKVLNSPDITCIVVVHYFGMGQNLDLIRKLCVEKSILLFEDCVHALFSKDDSNQYLGHVGDISFFSLPKILPTPDGAIFLINNPKYLHVFDNANYKKSVPGTLMIWVHLLYLLLKNIEIQLNYSLVYRLLNWTNKAIYVLYYWLLKKTSKPQRISKFTLQIIKNIDYELLISSRKKQIADIYESLRCLSPVLFCKVFNHHWMLTGVPIISEDYDEIIKILKTNNIECLSYKKAWLFIPENMDHQYIIESQFYQNHFLLPVHENNSNFIFQLPDLLIKSIN